MNDFQNLKHTMFFLELDQTLEFWFPAILWTFTSTISITFPPFTVRLGFPAEANTVKFLNSFIIQGNVLTLGLFLVLITLIVHPVREIQSLTLIKCNFWFLIFKQEEILTNWQGLYLVCKAWGQDSFHVLLCTCKFLQNASTTSDRPFLVCFSFLMQIGHRRLLHGTKIQDFPIS